MPAPLHSFAYRHPRRSSDSYLHAAAPGTPAQVFMVADMVGRPRALRWQRYMTILQRQLQRALAAHPPDSEAVFHEQVRHALEQHNLIISDLRARRDQSAFGFCISVAACWNRRVRILHLGDCRAYRLRRGGGDRAATAQCLTRDHHQLHDYIASGAHKHITPDRLTEYSHRLGTYLGMHETDRIAQALRETTDLELEPGDCLWLSTDGFHMPQVRAVAGHSMMKLTLSEYYLERWMAAQLAQADERIPFDENEFWPEIGEWLLTESLRSASAHKRYRDDIAVMGIYPPLPPGARRPPPQDWQPLSGAGNRESAVGSRESE